MMFSKMSTSVKAALMATVAGAAVLALVPSFSRYALAENVAVTQQANENIVRVDLRNRTEERLYSITFSAQTSRGDTGHAFITFNHENEQKRMTAFESVGFYPPGSKTSDSLLSFYLSVFDDAQLVNDFLHNADIKLIVTLNKEQYERARDVYAAWKKRQQLHENMYILGLNDCTTFVGEIARAVGLETSYRIAAPYPDDYVEALIKNQKEQQDAKVKEEQRRQEELKQKEEQKRKEEAARKLREQQAAAAAFYQMEMARKAAEAQRAAAAQAAAQAAAAAQQAAAQRAAAEQAAAQAAAARAAQEAAARQAAAQRAAAEQAARAQQEAAWAAQQRAQAEAAQRAAAEAAAAAARSRGPTGYGPSSGGGGYSGPSMGPMR